MTNKSISKSGSVAIVVLNYKGINDTKTALASLVNQTYGKFHIVAIENGSFDDSTDEFKELEKQYDTQLTIIYSDMNLGFAGGVNLGIRWAIEHNYEYVALFNNDARADSNWLASLVDKAGSNQELGIVTGLLLHDDGLTIDSTGEYYSKWGLPFPQSRNKNTTDTPPFSLIFGATGGATLYRISMFNDIGLFDENFFAYYEDVDISFRAQLAGYKIAYTPQAVAYHKQGATSSKIPGFTVYQTFKNLPILFWKNVPKELLLPVGSRFFLAYLLMYLNTFTHSTGWPATKGMIKSILLLSHALKERHHIQKQSRVSHMYIRGILWDDLPPDQTGLRKFRKLFMGE